MGIYTGRPGAASALMITLIIMDTVVYKKIRLLKSFFLLLGSLPRLWSFRNFLWNWLLLIHLLLQGYTAAGKTDLKFISDGS